MRKFLLLTLLISMPAQAQVHFVTFGDWGSGTPEQRQVAKALQSYCAQAPCGFVLTLGDNFYNFGVRSTTDSKWQTVYKDVYKDLHLPFYAVLGNHDELGNIQAQIDYSKIDSSWHLPGPYYSIQLPESNPIVEIFIINNGDDQFQPDEKEWLVTALAKSRARWKVLAMHKPIISNAPHGNNSSHINDDLVPVICGKVDLVLSGHDHLFSRLRGAWQNCNIDQVIVGTGGKRLTRPHDKDPRVVATGSFFGFGIFSATSKELRFKMIKTDGSVFYETTWGQ